MSIPRQTLVRFDLQTGARSERSIGRTRMSTVPAVGETINVNGDPYVVTQRGWAVTTNAEREDYGETYAFLLLSPLQVGQTPPWTDRVTP
jgi:hypothetical protein